MLMDFVEKICEDKSLRNRLGLFFYGRKNAKHCYCKCLTVHCMLQYFSCKNNSLTAKELEAVLSLLQKKRKGKKARDFCSNVRFSMVLATATNTENVIF